MQKFTSNSILWEKKTHSNHIISLSGSIHYFFQTRNIKRVKPKNKDMHGNF